MRGRANEGRELSREEIEALDRAGELDRALAPVVRRITPKWLSREKRTRRWR